MSVASVNSRRAMTDAQRASGAFRCLPRDHADVRRPPDPEPAPQAIASPFSVVGELNSIKLTERGTNLYLSSYRAAFHLQHWRKYHGARNSSLASWRADPDHHSSCSFLSLKTSAVLCF
jgi:hypothetical protein